MQIYVCWQADQLDGLVTTSLMSDNSTELRHISNDFERASDDLKQWALSNGGNIVMDLKTQGVIAVPPEKAPDFSDVKAKFESSCSAGLAVGMGMTVSEAYTALRMSKINGGGQISLYTPSMEQELINQPQEELFGKNLKKDDPEELASQPQGAEGAGMGQSPSDVKSQTGQAPAGSNIAPGQVQAAPQGSGATNIDEAERQKRAAGGGDGGGDAKAMIMSALQEVKANAGAISKLKSSSPAAYEAVKDVIQAMITMAESMAKSEDYADLAKALTPGMEAFKQHIKNRTVTDPPDVGQDFNGFGRFFDSQNPVNINELLQDVPHKVFDSKQYPGLKTHVVQGPTGGYVLASKNGMFAGIEPHRVGAEHNAIHPLDAGRVDIKEYAEQYHPKMGRITILETALAAKAAEEQAAEQAEAERQRQAALGPSDEHKARVVQEKSKPYGGVFGILGEHYVRPLKPAAPPVDAKSPLRNPGRNPFGAEFSGPGKTQARPAKEKPVYTPEQEAKFKQPQWHKDRLDAQQRAKDEDAKLRAEGHLKDE